MLLSLVLEYVVQMIRDDINSVLYGYPYLTERGPKCEYANANLNRQVRCSVVS